MTNLMNVSTLTASFLASSNLSWTRAFKIGFTSLILSIKAFTTSSLPYLFGPYFASDFRGRFSDDFVLDWGKGLWFSPIIFYAKNNF
ncbi:hypothetical protein Avbf_11636 [Armadillidium vulgare]|nr:hypothetical protein Avbf_11636 [Armadillidium vulgare]